MAKSIKEGVQLFEKKFALSVNEAKKKLASDIFKRLVDGTPVDTGHLKFNWQVSLRGFGEEREGNDPYGHYTLYEGLQTIKRAKTGQDIYIYNATSYGQYVAEHDENYKAVLSQISRIVGTGLKLKYK